MKNGSKQPLKTIGDNDIRDYAQEGIDFIDKKTDEYKKTFEDAIEPVKDRAMSLGDDVSTWVKKHPVVSGSIALSTAYLLGRFMRPQNPSSMKNHS